MSYELPDKLKKLVPYDPLSGNFHLRLDANESYISAPGWLREKIAQAVREVDFNRYPDPYSRSLCNRFGAFFDLNPENVVAGNGSDELITLIESAFLSAGDIMAVVKPDFSMYAFNAQMVGARVETFEKAENSLALNADDLIRFVQEKKAKLLILSNPCNPTSLRATGEEMEKIVRSLDCLVVADEAYMDFSEGSLLQMAADYDNLIVLKTCSKAFGMAAIRLGFAVACPQLTAALKAAKAPYNVNSMTQAVGTVLLGERDYLRDCIEKIKGARDNLFHALCTLAAEKETLDAPMNTCANFVFLPARDARGIFEKLREQGIAVRLMGEYLRISTGSPEENAQLIGALDKITV